MGIPLLRRPFYQRDLIKMQRDALAIEAKQLAEQLRLASSRAEIAEADLAHSRKFITAVQRQYLETAHHPGLVIPFARATGTPPTGDSETAHRIATAYRKAIATSGAPSVSYWDGAIASLKGDVHAALVAEDPAALSKILRDPGATDLFYGFDSLIASGSVTDASARAIALAVYSDLLNLAAALGVRRLWNWEIPQAMAASMPGIEEILCAIDGAVGFRVDFPNPFRGEVGLQTSRGVACGRAIAAIHQAWRVWTLAACDPAARIVEIGAGLGRTAYYAARFGIHDYTLVDLPMSGVAQAAFLCRVLAPTDVSLFGEDRRAVRIVPPAAFLQARERYDVALNADSLTEMARDVAEEYAAAIRRQARVFLSVNHEANPFSIADLQPTLGRVGSREPSWMRRGYVEEVFHLLPKDAESAGKET